MMSGTITPITMPKFGLAMTEGKIAGWLINPGAKVAQGDEIVEIETTKITNVYESPAAGTFRKQVASEGDTLVVGALIGVFADESVSDADIEAFIAAFQNTDSAENQENDDQTVVAPEFVIVGERRIRIQDANKTSDKGLPLLLIHGFGGDLTNWVMTQSDSARHGRVIAFDLPGHGESTKDAGDGSLATLAAITAELLKTLGIKKAHVAGHSLGGAVAIELAKANPSHVASLTLIAPAGLGKTVNATFIDGFINADRRKTLEPVLHLLVHDKKLISRQMIEGIIRFKRLDGAVSALKAIAHASFNDGVQNDDLHADLTNFKGPVTVIWGQDDEILSVEGARNLPEKITVKILSDTGHMPQMERPADVNAILADAIR